MTGMTQRCRGETGRNLSSGILEIKACFKIKVCLPPLVPLSLHHILPFRKRKFSLPSSPDSTPLFSILTFIFFLLPSPLSPSFSPFSLFILYIFPLLSIISSLPLPISSHLPSSLLPSSHIRFLLFLSLPPSSS